MKVAFLRGINVGGRNRLPMRDLTAAIGSIGGTRVRTVAQSGNAVFEPPVGDEVTPAAALAARLEAAIEANHGVRPRVLVLDGADLRRALDGNPFPEAEDAPTTLHLFFFHGGEADAAGIGRLEGARAPSERWALRPGVVYLHAPDGIGRSKLAERLGRVLGDGATARNWRTATRTAALLDDAQR